MSDEMKALKDFGEALGPPSGQPPVQLRRRVLTAQPRPFARLGLRLAVAATCAVAVGAVAMNLGGTAEPPAAGPSPSRDQVTAAQLLEYAADYAEAAPELTARPDQFIFTESVVVYQQLPMNGSKSTLGPRTMLRQWRSADGHTRTRIETRPYDGTGAVWQASTGADRNEPVTLPAEADAMYAYLYRDADGDDERALAEAAHALYLGQQSPATQAAVFAAVKRIPGVTVREGATDVIGRAGVAVVYTSQGNETELVFNPVTYQYLGVNRKIDWVLSVSQEPEMVALNLIAREALVRVAIVDRVGD